MKNLNGVPVICTTEISRFLRVGIKADFIIEFLEVEPLLQTKTGTFWKKSDLRYIAYQMGQYMFGIHEDAKNGNIHENPEII